jgi:hypothetical protein
MQSGQRKVPGADFKERVMLQFGAKTFTIDGVTVFSDHADPLQFWFLPAPVDLARRPPDKRAAFTLIKWKPAAVAAGVKGGGFLTFETSLRLPPETERRIKSQLSSMVRGGKPVLSAVQFDEGTVRCVGLDLEGPGGTLAPASTPGTFRAIEAIRGASIPSLAGDNTAAFSLTLTQEGAIILEKAFGQGTTPVGVIYDLKFTGLRPALNVKITADYEKIFNHFSAGLEAQVYWVKAGIDAGFEKLVSEGVIKIEVIDFIGAEDRQDKENWALDFFKENLLSKWFEPSLTPADMEARMAKPEGLDAVLKRAADMLPKPAQGQGNQNQGNQNQGGQNQGGQNQGQTVRERQPVQFAVTRSPEPPPNNANLACTPSAQGTQETVTVSGPAGWTATVGGQPARVDGNRILVDVPANQSREVVVEWPASPGQPRQETYELFFEFEKPEVLTGWNTRHPVYLSYLADSPNPPDPEFSNSAAPGRQAPPGGARALQDWCDRLVSPRVVTMTGHASFENDSSDAKKRYNLALSRRRLDIAKGIIGSRATVPPGGDVPRGQQEAEAARRVRDRTDRVVKIIGTVAGDAGTPAVRLVGRLTRPADVERQQPGGQQPGGQQPGGQQPGGQQPAPSTGGGSIGSGTPAVVSFKMKFIRQEERKTMTLIYNRTEAVQRTYAPQGFFGLLLKDIQDRSKHFVEVDLDDPFFRQFEVVVDAPIDFERIGLTSAQVGIDYGDPGDRRSMKHKDFIFDQNAPSRQSFTTFMSPDLASAYSYGVQFHFNPNSGWDGEKLTYEIPVDNTLDRTLVVTPFDHMGFLEIEVVPNRIDAQVVDFTQVDLLFTDPSGWVARKTLRIKPGTASQFWKVRTSHRDARTFTYQLSHHLKDGRVLTDDAVTSTANAVIVDDPFEAALDLEFVPLWDPATMRSVFVDLIYSDPENDYERSERLTFEGADVKPRSLRISLRERERRAYRYKATFVTANGRMIRRPEQETTETIIGLSEADVTA